MSESDNSKSLEGADDPSAPAPITSILTGHLPLQHETTYFIFVSTLDIFLTYMLLRFDAIEANPIANRILIHWGFLGMIGFKLLIVAGVCVAAQIIALRKFQTAKLLLWFGSLVTAAVVIYSMLLFYTHI